MGGFRGEEAGGGEERDMGSTSPFSDAVSGFRNQGIGLSRGTTLGDARGLAEGEGAGLRAAMAEGETEGCAGERTTP